MLSGLGLLDLENENRIKHFLQQLNQILTILHKFSLSTSTYSSDESQQHFSLEIEYY